MKVLKKPVVGISVAIGILGLLYVVVTFLQTSSNIDIRITDSAKLLAVLAICMIGFLAGRKFLSFTGTTTIFVLAMVFLSLYHVTELTEEFESLKSLPVIGEGGAVKLVYESVIMIGSICFFIGGIYFSVSKVEKAREQLDADVIRLKEIEGKLRQSRQSYRDFIEKSMEGIVHLEYSTPIPVNADHDQQTEMMFTCPVITECNDVYAQMYGFESSKDLIGKPGVTIWGQVTDNLKYYAYEWIKSDYRLDGVEVFEPTAGGKQKWFLNSLFGIVEDGCLTGAWGIQIDVTERRKAEEEKERLTAILEATSDLVSTADKDGRIMYMNSAGRNMLGWKEDSMTSRPISDAHPEWAYEIIKNEGLPACIEKGIWRGETAILDHEGNEIPVSQVIMSHKSPEGELLYLSTVIRDISERIEAENNLREKEFIIESASNAIATCDMEGNLNYANPAFLKMWGFEDCQEFLGDNLSRFWMIGDTYDEIIGILMSDGAWFGESKARRKDGSLFDVQVSAAMVFDSEGNPVGMMFSSTDITARTKAECALEESYQQLQATNQQLQTSQQQLKASNQQLIESEGHLRSLIDTAPTIILHLSSDNKIREFNPEAERFFGCRRSEVIGKDYLEEFIGEEQRDGVAADIRKVLNGEPTRGYGNPLTAADGSVHTFVWNVDRIVDHEGNAIGIVAIGQDVTDSKRAEEALREREETIRALVETSQDWIWSIDLDGVHTYSNPAVANILGYPPEEFMGNPSLEKMHPEDRKEIEKIFPDWIAEKRGWKNQLVRWLHKDGDYRYLESSAVPIVGVEGNLTGFRGVDRDITQRIQAEEALRQSEEQHRLLFESANDAIFVMDESIFLDCNVTTLEMFGCEREDILHHSPIEFSPPEQPCGKSSAGMAREKIDLTFSGEPQRFEWLHNKKNGELFNAEISLNRIEMPGGTFIQAIVRDITERKHAEKALAQSEEKFSKAFYANPNYMVLVDFESRCRVDINDSFTRITGYSREEVLGRKLGGLKIIVDMSKIEEAIPNLMKTGSVRGIEARIRTKTGEMKTLLFSAETLELLGKIHVLISGQDITDRKVAELKLLEYQEQLRSLASELSLAEERQRHEISTNLHDSISQELAFSMLALKNLRESDTGDNTDQFDRLQETISHMIDHVRDLTFDLSSPTLYKFGLEAAVLELLENRLESESGIGFEFNDDKAEKPLDEDVRVLLFQCVRELLINIVKHSRAKKALVSIERDMDNIRVSISDDGRGFDVDKAKVSSRQGGGLGLFNIAERLDYISGSFEIESEPGKGSRFTLVAPLKV